MRGSIASHVARRIGRLWRVRPRQIEWPGGAVSFTFDDYPVNALTAGGAILEKHGFRGTYYAALGLAGTMGNQGPVATLEQIRETRERGHELACHGYGHLDYSRTAAPAIIDDLRHNADAFAELLDGFTPTNFAYPFGRYLLPGKKLLAPRYDSCRGTTGGSNHGTVDLGDLLGTRIYAPQFDEAAMRRLIDQNRETGGWIIFYTHDVQDDPSPYGCTAAQLESVVTYAAECAEVLPVRDVLARLN